MALAFLFGNVTGEQAQPRETATDAVGLTGGPVTAASICERPETEVYLVTSLGEGQRYEAKYEVPGEPRFDLTWQVGGAVVAVERLDGAEWTVTPEQVGPDFEQACITNKNVTPIELGE